MIKYAVFITILVTAGLIYLALTQEPDLVYFDLKKLKNFIESPRPALDVDPNIKESRQQFARLIMDYAEHENRRLKTIREIIPGIIRRQTKQTQTDDALLVLLNHFKIDPSSSLDRIEGQLYLKVDGLPVALVATQAAIESAWGVSRFAVEGNNFFGHQCYKKGCGIKPKNSANDSLEVRRFDTIGDSVAAYYHNINTHKAYNTTRKIRFSQREQRKRLTTKILIPTLGKYSELGSKYLKTLYSVFRSEYIQLAFKNTGPHENR